LSDGETLAAKDSPDLTLAAFLEESREQRWLERYSRACEQFTYPKCPQLQTSQGMVNIAKRKRDQNENTETVEESSKPVKASRTKKIAVDKIRDKRDKTVKRKNSKKSKSEEGSQKDVMNQLDSATHAVISKPMESQRLENLWDQAESFAIFDDEDEEECEEEEEEEGGGGVSGSESSDVSGAENGEITLNEWI
jgi:hypothetical protein